MATQAELDAFLALIAAEEYDQASAMMRSGWPTLFYAAIGAAITFSQLTILEVDGAPSIVASVLEVAQASGLVLTNQGGGVARLSIADATTSVKGVAIIPNGAASLVLATPSGGSGAASLRALVAGDLPTTPVAKGGTGVTTLANRGLVVGRDASPVAVTGPGTTGQVLTSNGASADPTFQTPAVDAAAGTGSLRTLGTAATQAAAGNHSHGVSTGGTGVATLAAHGVVVGNGTGAVAVTGPGAAGQVLTSNGASADPTFQAAPGADDSYAPSLVNVANAPTLAAYLCPWIRAGNAVMVSGKLDFTATTAEVLTRIGISLPVASNITALEDLAGTGAATGTAQTRAARIWGDATNDRAELGFYPEVAGSARSVVFTFMYRIQ